MSTKRERAVLDVPRHPLDPPAATEWAERVWLELHDEWESDALTALHDRFGEWVRTQVPADELCARLASASQVVALRPVRAQVHLYVLQRRRRGVGRPGGVWDSITPDEIYREFAEDQRLVQRFLQEQYALRLESPGAEAA